jgi:hypothetical protein
MNIHPVRSNNWFLLLLVLSFVILIISLLSGCTGTKQQLGDSSSTPTSQTTALSSTNTPNSEGTNTPTGKQDFNTRVAQHMADIATEAALSPRPTVPEGPVYIESPIPTPTWATGYFYGQIPENTFNPAYANCWAGYLNNNLLELCAGHEQLGGDPRQGVLLVRVWEQDQVTRVSEDVYQTPEKVGVVHIVVADSNSVTVTSEDGQSVFTFDIATRQWVPNPPLPTPSVSPLPLPSASP